MPENSRRGSKGSTDQFHTPSASAQACSFKARCEANSGSIGKQRNAADACLSARPTGRSGWAALCVVISRQVPTCLRNHALIAVQPECQKACGINPRFPESPRCTLRTFSPVCSTSATHSWPMAKGGLNGVAPAIRRRSRSQLAEAMGRTIAPSGEASCGLGESIQASLPGAVTMSSCMRCCS